MGTNFFFNDTATTEIYTLSLHDALPILPRAVRDAGEQVGRGVAHEALHRPAVPLHRRDALVPGGGTGRRVGGRPVARRPFRGPVLRAVRELADIPLPDPDVLGQAPGGEWVSR